MKTNALTSRASRQALRSQHPEEIEPTNSASGTAVSHDDIATRAYYSYMSKGSQSGFEDRDWLDAEAEIRTDRRLSEAFDIGKIA